MYSQLKFLLISFLIFISLSCAEKISYSGKILNTDFFDYKEINNKNELTIKFGQPNYIDPIENKYYYYSEEKITTNFYKNEISRRILMVFMFDDNENIKSVSEYNLNDQQDIDFNEDKTPNQIIKRGLIKKIFGGVGKNVPNTLQ